MGTSASRFDVAFRLAIGGLGMGQLGPSMVLVVQNAVAYKDLGVATAGLSFLRSLGIKKGDRVAIILPNVPQYVIGVYGILKVGGVVVLGSPLSNEEEITYQLQHRKCGKASCSTCRNGQGHGLYWYAYWREGSRLRSGYIGKIHPSLHKQIAGPENKLETPAILHKDGYVAEPALI